MEFKDAEIQKNFPPVEAAVQVTPKSPKHAWVQVEGANVVLLEQGVQVFFVYQQRNSIIPYQVDQPPSSIAIQAIELTDKATQMSYQEDNWSTENMALKMEKAMMMIMQNMQTQNATGNVNDQLPKQSDPVLHESDDNLDNLSDLIDDDSEDIATAGNTQNIMEIEEVATEKDTAQKIDSSTQVDQKESLEESPENTETPEREEDSLDDSLWEESSRSEGEWDDMNFFSEGEVLLLPSQQYNTKLPMR
jgi:hypothetical protein